MAMEASDSGATGAGGGLLARAEAEENKEREMEGEVERIARRDDNGGSGSHVSFSMVAISRDSDGTSDSEEKAIGMVVGDGGAGDPLAVPVRVVEGKGSVGREGNGREEVGVLSCFHPLGEEERDRRDSFPVVNGWKGGEADGGEDSTNDGEGSEEIRAEQKEGGAVVIEDSKGEGPEEEVADVEVSKNGVKNQVEEGVFIVEDSKDEMEAAVGDLNKQDAVMGLDDGASEGIEAPNVQNVAGNVTEGQSIGDASGHTFSSDPTIDVENEVLMSSVAQPENKDVELVSEIHEKKIGNDERSGVVESSVNEKKEFDSAYEIEEKRDFNDEVLEGVDSSEPVNEEITSIYELEDRRDADNEGCEDVESSTIEPKKKGFVSNSGIEERTNNEGHKNVDSEVKGYAEEEVDSGFEVDDRKIANDDFSICSNRKNETKLAIQVDENLQNIATTTVSDSENGELNSSVEQAQQHHLSAFLPKSDSVSSIKLIAESVEEKIVSASLVGLSIGAASGQTFSSDLTIDEKQNFESLLQENVVFVSSVAQPENKDVELVSEIEEKKKGNDERSGVVEYSVNEKKEVGSASEIEERRDFIHDVLEDADSSEPAKEEITSIYELEDRRDANIEGCEDVESSAIEPTKKGLVSGSGIEERTNDEVRKDLKSEKDLIYQTINENRELKSTAKLTKHAEIQQENAAASSASAGDGEKAEKLVKKYYIVKIRRFNQRVIDDERQAKIHEAKVQIDEKTRSQDSVMAELRNMRTVLSGCCDRRDSAIKEEKRVKSLVNAKRQEIDSTQALISKGKNVASFLNINSQIHALEHKIQHETISLKDEKNCLQELKRLKHERENHPFNNYSESEFDVALKQKETAESSLRTLKKEFDILKREHSKADEYSKAASKSYFDQLKKIKEHEKKWKAANDQRQNAFKNFRVLTSDKHFKMYLNDRQTAMKYASSGDTEALERFCKEQIERVMQLWNEDEDFRRQYVESSAYSRTRGRNVEFVVPPPSTTRSTAAPVTAYEEQMLIGQVVTKPVLQTKQMVRSNPSSKSTSTGDAPVIGALKEELVEAAMKEKLKKEEVEQARLADEQGREQEELMKEREAAELKEKLRMLQKSKAKEAEERKRRRTEKAQARAEYRAQKEAELREQKRAYKQKKKETTSETSESVEGNPATVAETFSQETAEEPENNQRRSSRKSAAAALNKFSNDRIQPVPLPLRNKGKRKMSMWKCVVFGVAVVLLFIALLHFSDLAF